MFFQRNITKIRTHSLLANAVSLFFLQFGNYVVPLILLPFLTHTLGTHSFGLVAITLAAIQLAFVLTDYGFSLSATYAISVNRSDAEYINNKISSVFVAKLFLVLVSCLVMIAVPWAIAEYRPYSKFFSAGLLAVVAQAFQPTWLFQGTERMKKVVIYNIATKILYAALVLTTIKGPRDALLVIYFWGISQAVGLITSLYFTYMSGYRLVVPSFDSIKSEFKEGAHFFWSRIAVSIYTSVSAMFIGLNSVSQAAHFSVCEQVYKAGQNATAPINSAMFPYMAKSKNWSTFYFLVVALGTIIMIGCVLISGFTEQILTRLFGVEYASASPVLSVFLSTIVVNYFSVAFGYPAFSALGKIGPANYSVVAGAVLHCVFLAILYFTKSITAYHVAVMILITEVFVLLFRIIYFIKLKKNNALLVAP